VVHACNPSNLGGRDQEDCGLKPAWANSLRDPILKKSMIKKGGGVAQVEALSSNASTTKTKTKFFF
jgi:hypothetical protein